MTNTNINFTKRKLESLKASTKPTWYYATNFEGLALFVGKRKKTYYAHWSIPVVDKLTGNIKMVGKRKKLGGFNIPLDEIKALVRKNLDDLKKVSLTVDGSLTVGGLCSAFIKSGSAGYRVKVKGAKIKYKKKTTFNNNLLLNTYVLLKTKKGEIISMMTDPFKYNGVGYVKEALKDIPLNRVSKRDIEIAHTRMEKIPTTANRVVAALSVAFEWDMKRSTDRLYKGDNNPCLRISKYQESKDKKHLVLNKVIEVRSYCLNEQWRDAHFLTFYALCFEIGERLEDLFRLVWHKPRSLKEIESCSGWLDLENKSIHLTDSKDRKAADVGLTVEAIQMLQQLQKYNSERKDCAFALGTPWIFPRKTDPSKPINNNSYRVKLKHFNYKFGLATREYVRGKGKRIKYKYTNEYTLKHLRKTFVTHYARGKNKDGTERGLVQASLRMRHSSPKVTKDHYFTEDQEQLRVDHMYDTNVATVDFKKKEQK
jgi:hypothetical protein|tara:strand:- start:270 stop:1718 length:1449 start_codon:yes stop_codon:yes gene_type:complete